MDRRLKIYRDANPADSGHSVQDFFAKALGKLNGDIPISENVKTVHAISSGDMEQLVDIQEFIEKRGKPCCLNLITDRDNKFLRALEKQQKGTEKAADETQQEVDPSLAQHTDGGAAAEDDEDELAEIMRQEEEENRRKVAEEAESKSKEGEEAEKRRAKEASDMAKAELIKQQERDLLDTRSQPIRQYLMDNLVPFLTQGLIELCKKVPADPVDNLADFLLKKADEIDQKKIKDREAVLRARMEAKRLKQARQ